MMDLGPQRARVDRYPSRDGAPARLLPRGEPVLRHTLGADAPGPLTRAQLEAFDRDGFVLLPRLLATGEVESLAHALDAMLAEAGRDAARPDVIREAESDAVRSLFRVHEDGAFAELAADPRIAGAARQILGGEVDIHQSRINAKPGLVGRPFSWHSDFETWHAEDGMPHMAALSASVWLSDNQAWSGPLLVVPGSHRVFVTCPEPTPPRHWEASLVDQRVGSPSAEALCRLLEHVGRDPEIVTGPAGSVLLFDCNTMHASSSNLSPHARRNAFFVYRADWNRLEAPFGAAEPRPEMLASRAT